MSKVFLWNLVNKLDIESEIQDKIKKITNIENHLYILTYSNILLHGVIKVTDDREVVHLTKHDGLFLKDIDCVEDLLYGIDLNGRVFKYTENLICLKEILLIEDSKPCSHGSTENGQLWACGNMHQIGISSETPRKVTFFENRIVYSASVGSDFAIAIVSKQYSNEDLLFPTYEEEVFSSTCPHCTSSSRLASPASQNSGSESCPLGIPIPASYDIETTSTSSKNDSLSSNDSTKFLKNETSQHDADENVQNGEEYLVECTEKPTRIIKENVSNMASLVYEGVKTVGDKVVTLSRHMSGSSDNNDVLESIEDIHLPRVTSKDEFMWSLSQGTSEKDISEQGVEERSNAIIKTGSNLVNREIWTWGNIVHGQLGIGDIIKRERPMIITKLSNIGAQKISVQSYHVGVLTLDGRSFLWGRNDYHQVTVESDIDQSSPKLFNTQSNERVKDISCGTYHTTILTYKNDLYYIGRHAENVRKLNMYDINTNDLNKKMQLILFDLNTQKKDKKNDEQIIQTILMKPFVRLTFYHEFLIDVISNTNKQQKFKDILSKWNGFVDEQEFNLKLAEKTNTFWTTHAKTVEHLKTPDRRIIRESHEFPIHLYNAGLFSSHWFILLNDVFIHMNGSTSIVHDLKTIWVEPQQDSTSGQFQISLKMPEESMDLYTTKAEEKIQWFHILQNAIKSALGKNSAHQPPLLRSAAYTFFKTGCYKDAKYMGRWLNAKMHGSGKIEWPDGKMYTGQFNNNQMHGFGRMDMPNIGVYEGQWKENQQNGFGILKYSNGDVYKGYFKDGVPHGHGSYKQGNFTTSAASIYIGDWILGSKSGYGIMHDIISGEKYLGNWNDNKKHGKGLIVTSDGIYYEGVFNQDILTGSGLMILEDGTFYEGDFKGTGILGGKGTLTLNSGHVLEGNLTGSWNEGIKISNGNLTLMKPVVSESDLIPKSFTSFCTPTHQKWKALFRYCYQILGVPDCNLKTNIKPPDTQKIWQNVAVVISNSFHGTVKCNKIDRGIENSINNLDTIPQFGRDNIDGESYKNLKQYVVSAFECSYHPLGSLLADLTVAYTTSYGGLRPHPLLLLHAVNELHSITKRLYDIVRLLFPALPSYDKQYSLKDDDESEIVSCQSLLYPIILPKVHSSLFILYTLKSKRDDMQYWKRLSEWNKQTDFTLMAFLSVDQKFLNVEAKDEPLSPIKKVKEQHFIEAIETLQLLKTTFSPIEKLFVIKHTFQKMTTTVQQQLGQNYRWNMDDLFPVFLYVVVRARILQLGSELDFIQDFMEPSLENGELGIMFTTLKACYQQILQEKYPYKRF
ncbi:MORN repeat [Popillia japonica]|uniref:MORN repeat n=1 Tax=Popillia japonica TaxID=7064 RepID=A0AAW1LZ57_POPJA